MRKRKKYYPALFLGLLSLAGLSFYIFFIDPKSNFKISHFEISPIIFFFVLFISSVASITSFLLLNLRRGILLAIFLSSLLLLKFFGFTSYLYIVILFVIVLLLELGFRKR